jgi:hypothetical protein
MELENALLLFDQCTEYGRLRFVPLNVDLKLMLVFCFLYYLFFGHNLKFPNRYQKRLTRFQVSLFYFV